MSEKNIYERLIERYGPEKQLEMVIEECAELIKAIQKYKRVKPGHEKKVVEADVIGEGVDVEIMIEQLKLIFPNRNLWNALKRAKLRRGELKL